MDKYKEEFKICFAQAMQKNLLRWKKFQRHYLINLYTKDLSWYFISFLVGFIPGKRETHYDLKFHICMAVILLIITIIRCIKHENKKYQNEVKSTFYKNLLKIFGENIYYNCKIGLYNTLEIIEECKKHPEYVDNNDFEAIKEKKISNYTFNNSELLKGYNIGFRDDDDVFWGEFSGVEFRMCETELSRVEEDKKSHKKAYSRLFKGLAMQFTINKNIESRVLIISKGLKNNIPKGYEKVNLEYEKFNKKYNVYAPVGGSQGQIEARYLFNTAFLDRFMQIQTSFKIKKMQCSIKGNTILMLLSTNRDLFEMNHLFGEIDDPKQYSKLFDEFASVLSFIDVLNLSSKTKL